MRSFKEHDTGVNFLLMGCDEETYQEYLDLRLLSENDKELYHNLREWIFKNDKRGIEYNIKENGNCCIDAMTLKDCFEIDKISFLSIIQEMYMQPLTFIGVNAREDKIIEQNTQNLIYQLNHIVKQKCKIVNINVDNVNLENNVLLEIMQDLIDIHYKKDINDRYIMLHDVIEELKLKYES